MPHRPLLLALLILGMGSPVQAQGSDAIRREGLIRDQGQEAARLFKAGDHRSALEAYQAIAALLEGQPGRAQELSIVRVNIGRCHEALNEARAAAGAYEAALGPDLPEQLATGVAARLERLEKTRLGEVSTRCPDGPAQVEIEGLGAGRVPCGQLIRKVPVGEQAVLAFNEAGAVIRQPLRVTAGERAETTLRFEQAEPFKPPVPIKREPDRTVAWTLTGVGGALITTGVVFYGLAVSANGDYEDELDAYADLTAIERSPSRQRQVTDAFDTVIERRDRAYLFLGLGAAVAAASLWWWVDDDAPGQGGGPETRAELTPNGFRLTF